MDLTKPAVTSGLEPDKRRGPSRDRQLPGPLVGALRIFTDQGPEPVPLLSPSLDSLDSFLLPEPRQRPLTG